MKVEVSAVLALVPSGSIAGPLMDNTTTCFVLYRCLLAIWNREPSPAIETTEQEARP